MAIVPREKREKRIAALVEMGVSRAAAKAALRAKSWQTDEAALIVFDERYGDAVDIPTSDEEDAVDAARPQSFSPAPDKGKGKSKQKEVTEPPTPEEDENDMVNEDNDDYDEEGDEYYDDEDIGGDLADSDAASVTYGDGDAYGFLDTSKDRKVEIKEVEEPVKPIIVFKTKRGQVSPDSGEPGQLKAEIFGLQRWLSGCPEGSEQQQLFPLYSGLMKSDFMPTRCPYQCGGSIEHYESDFFAIPDDFTEYIDRLCHICQVACPKCEGIVCLACNEPRAPVPLPSELKDYTRAPEVLLHCANLQAVIIGVGLHLAGDDVLSATAITNSNQRKRKVSSGLTSIDVDGDDAQTGSARRTHFEAGTGYGGGRNDVRVAVFLQYTAATDDLLKDSGIKATAKAQQEKDKQLANLLSYVRVYLPNRDRPGPFQNSDHMPASQTLAHLRRRFNPIASMLLGAESLSDMSERKELYTEFMAWLEVMSGHENLAGLMGQPIMRISSVTYPDAPPTSKCEGREKIIVFHSSPGPRELLERIISQVHVAKKVALAAKAREDALQKEREAQMTEEEKYKAAERAEQAPTALEQEALGDEKGAEESGRLLEFCDVIEKAVFSIDKALKQSKRGEAVLRSMKTYASSYAKATGSTSSAMSASLPQGGSCELGSTVKTSSLAGLAEEETQEKYTEWAKEVNYGYYDWSMPTREGETLASALAYKHSYSAEAVGLTSNNVRNTVLMKEHASLSSSLPAGWNSSVFLLTDEGRPDIMKALVIGPDDTPYENGCFIFDILLGGAYNQAPPSVKSMTTKNWHYRLNPNLYADGKVCLSLLGTWTGPGWVAGKSTLLQVLISIQSMILWSEPITNEPGFEKDLKSTASKAYNANVRRMVAHISILEYLKNPPEGFEEIVKTHFRLKARCLTKQLDRWLEEDDGAPLYADSMTAATMSRSTVGPSSATHLPTSTAATAKATGVAAGSSSGRKATLKKPATAFAKDIAEIKKLLEKLESEG